MASASIGAAGKRARRPKRWLAALALGAVLACIAGEIALRFLLFSDTPLAQRVGRAWRWPPFYVESPYGDDYWKLQSLFERDRAERARADAKTGWTGAVEPGTYAHPDEARVGRRRPVLLYGDSNAQCLTGANECFQGLLERSELRSTHALVNYGVGGFGLDQIYLMLRATIDRWASRDPIVVVSVLVDDDLVRSRLSFRGWPKPRFRVEDGKLVDPAPVDVDVAHFLDEHPPEIASYLYRYVRHVWRPFAYLPEEGAAEIAEGRELNRAILEAIRDELERRSLRWFVLLFYFDAGLHRAGAARWSEDVLLEFVHEHDVPFVSMKDFLGAACDPGWKCLDDLVGLDDPVLRGHYNEAGNRLAFEALRQGIEGRFGDDSDLERVRRRAAADEWKPRKGMELSLAVCGRDARYLGDAAAPCARFRPADDRGERARLALRAGAGGATTLEVDLGGETHRLRASASAFAASTDRCLANELVLSTRTDGGKWTSRALAIGGASSALEVDLAHARTLEIRVEYAGADPGCAWASLDHVTIE